jgi:hypothetical protein
MHEELENFERNQVWELVEPPPGCKPIDTKWAWKNKDEDHVWFEDWWMVASLCDE